MVEIDNVCQKQLLGQQSHNYNPRCLEVESSKPSLVDSAATL